MQINRKEDLRVAIVLSTYNGENYIVELLESILDQSYQDFLLYVRDDGSKDKTLSIINDYKKKDDRIILLSGIRENLGPCQSFLTLISRVEADLLLFADQDDIWHKNKIAVLLSIYSSLNNNSVPILLHSDLKVVSDNMNTISNSFWSYQNIDPYKGMGIKNAICQNSVTGCAMLINCHLKEEMIKYLGSHNIIMHDWLALILASMRGSVYAVPLSLISYRQHDNNNLGAIRGDAWSKFLRKGFGGLRKSIVSTMRQSHEIARLASDAPDVVRKYGCLADASSIARKISIIRLGIRKQSILETFVMVLIA